MIAKLDRGLLLSALFFLGLGLVQVYSSSFIYAIESYGDGFYFLKKQLLFVLIGAAILILVARLKLKWIKALGVGMWSVATAGIFLTVFSPLGIKVGGAFRWLQLPFGLRFEPSEMLKISLPIMLGVLFGNMRQEENLFFLILKVAAVFVPIGLLLKQPDFGSLVICTFVISSLLFVYGLKWRFILAGMTLAVPAFYFLVVQVPYRWARVQAFLDPWSDPAKKGFQVIQSMLSIHSGGMIGSGLGQGQGKLFFLPEAHTDFTLAVLGEELGFIGLLFVLLLYGYIVFRGLQIAIKSQNQFCQLVALGLTLVFGSSVFVNVGVVMGLLPTKGLALPFLSYGGSSLICTCILIGVLLSVDKELNGQKAFRGYKL